MKALPNLFGSAVTKTVHREPLGSRKSHLLLQRPYRNLLMPISGITDKPQGLSEWRGGGGEEREQFKVESGLLVIKPTPPKAAEGSDSFNWLFH
ncbi:hypothetical protein AOLI_G00151710 [Acnodon oligacanthus]